MDLIRELAEFEKAPDEVDTSVATMERDGFGDRPVFEFFIAEEKADKKPVGLALYYYSYSTWKGKCLYLEDLVVTESCRGKGLGKQLFDAIVLQAKDSDSKRVVWPVLDWNEPSIGFYKWLGVEIPGEWLTCRLDSAQIQNWMRLAER
jgi:GNAT superfamily N-acetyltransferase